MFTERFDIPLQVDASGNGTAYSAQPVGGGLIRQIQYTPDPNTPLATGAVVTVTGEETGLPVIAITGIGTVLAVWAPRQPTHTEAGAASLYAGSGQPVNDLIAISAERLKIVVSGGGVSKLGTFSIWIA